MSINQTDDFSAKPYHDDFKREKNQYKILFKPTTPVQVRELNAMQSMLQDQIAVIGSHLFKNGSMVIPGTPRYNPTLSYVFIDKLADDLTLSERIAGKYVYEIVDTQENIRLNAIVDSVIDYGTRACVFLNYMNSAVYDEAGVTKNQTEFGSNVELTLEGSTETIRTSTTSDQANVPVTGKAKTLSVASGVYYVDGYFVYTPEQKIVVGFNNDRLNIKAGLVVEKQILTAYDDESLYDNALGSPNEGAEGADRFIINLKLDTLSLSDEETNFIELIRLENGYLRVSNVTSQYNVLADTMARRTYDESGDYAVRGFDIKVYEDLKDETDPNGFLTAENGGDPNMFVAEVSSGKGYVKGYEVENYSNYFIEALKARTSDCEKSANDVIQVNEYGEYIYLAPGNQFFDISKHPIIWLTSGQESTSDVLGYCIPKYVDSVSISGQTIFKLFGTFQLFSTISTGWQNIGGWRLSQLKNGPVLQVLNLYDVVSNYNVVDGLQLTSHTGYTPYAWDSTNRRLFVKKTASAPAFDKTRAVIKGGASGYVTSIDYKFTNPLGNGELFKLSLSNIKTTKDSNGNHELQTDLAFTTTITTNSSGYGEYQLLGSGIFVGQPVAAHTSTDVAYFNNLVQITDSGKRLVVNNSAYPNGVFAISAIVRKTLAIKSKSLSEGSSVLGAIGNKPVVLGHSDIYRLKHVYVSANASTPATEDDEDLVSNFELVNNDDLDFYKPASLKVKGGYGVPTGRLLVVYEYFIHSAGDVFNADSYVSLRDNVPDETDVTHISRIPKFYTKDQGYVLSNYIDFRKQVREGFFIVKANITNGSPNVTVDQDYRYAITAGAKVFSAGFEANAATVVSVSENGFVLSHNSNVTGNVYMVINSVDSEIAAEPFATSVNTWSSISDSTVTYDATYFVDRYDRIVINSNGQISYVYGVAGVGSYPEVPADAMSLARVQVPAYTHHASQIVFKKDDNRRYTMRDIGKLEDRIENLEYYTTLTMKELETKNLKILDAEGYDRFKSGLFVSNFKDFGVFDPFQAGSYDATLVPEQDKMIPLQYAESADFKFNELDSSGFVVRGNKIFMEYTHYPEIRQPYATHYQTVNPYLVIDWSPEITLVPSVDTWVETEWAATITNISNVVRNTTSSETFNTTTNMGVNVLPNRTVSDFYGANWQTPSAQTNQWNSSNTVTSRQQIQSTAYETSSTTENRLLGTSVIPMMRSRDVHVAMVGGKPETRYWVRFDNVDVTQHCAPYNPNTLVRGQTGAALISDGMGRLDAIFRIPPNSFRTGERILEVSDLDKEANPDGLEFCFGTATYTANGTLRTMQEIVNVVNTTINNTHTIITNNTQISVNRQTTNFNNLGWAQTWDDGGGGDGGGDPLAQSFFTSDVDGDGIFVTKIDLFFAKKDTSAPVFFELKEVVNGMPVNRRIPGSLIYLPPEAVVVSDDSTVPTSFEFRVPLYLQSNREYALVCGSASPRYGLWVARMGEKVINEDRVVAEQPSLGSLFKSQNNSTWTPYQLEDVKFTLHRAHFNPSNEGHLRFENVGSGMKRKLDTSRIQTTSGSKLVRIYHPNHGAYVNENVKLFAEDGTGITSSSPAPETVINGVPMSEIYGVKLVKAVHSLNEYSIEVITAATKTGYFDTIGKYIYGTSNVNFNSYRLNVVDFIPSNTDVTYSTEIITGKDFDGGQTPFVRMPETYVNNHENNNLSDVGLIQIPENESSEKSVYLNAVLRTGMNTVCPVIDLDNNSIIVSSLALNKPEIDEENLSTNGLVTSKAMTQVIRLTTLSNSVRVYLTENKQERDAIDVWIRVAADRNISEKNWTKLTATNIAIQSDTETFVEHEYVLDNVIEFDEYQVKICFKGTDSTKFPSVKELRAITVAS